MRRPNAPGHINHLVPALQWWVRGSDRFTFTSAGRSERMSDKDLLAVVLGGVALLMFATGIILAI
jgi:hypothetical protein